MLAPFGLRPKATLAQRMLPLAAAMERRGWSCQIVAPAYTNPEDASRVEVVDGVQGEHVALPRLAGAPGVVETAVRMLQAALRAEPTILHAFKPKGYSGLAALLARIIRPELPLA